MKRLALNLEKKRWKAGFTFIELVVVMMIIAMLTVLAVGAFGGSQRTARLNYATDSLVSAIKEQRQLAKSGTSTVGENQQTNLLCYALKLEKASGDREGQVLVAFPKYLPENDQCEKVADEVWRPREVTGLEVKLSSITLDSAELDQFELYFKPPFGYVYRYEGGAFSRLITGNVILKLTLGETPGLENFVKMEVETDRVYRSFKP